MREKISFVNAYVLALVEVGGCQRVYSFDKGLEKVGGKEVVRP